MWNHEEKLKTKRETMIDFVIFKSPLGFPGSLGLEFGASTEEDMCYIPGWGTKILKLC